MHSTNIAIFIRSIGKGGAEKQSILLHEYLSIYYNSYLIVYEYKSTNSHPILSDNVIFLKGNIIFKIINLYYLMRQKKIIYLFNYLPVNNILGVLIGKLAGVKYLFGGIRTAKYNSTVKMMLSKYICNYMSTGFISNSFAAAETYSQYGFNKNKICVIHNGIKEVTLGHKNNSDKIIILSIGRFIEEKDIVTGINAVCILIQKYPLLKEKILYKIVGYGKLETELKQFINYKKMRSIIDLRSDGNVSDSYNYSDIFLNTSVFEGMPNVLMEAMNYSLPVVATDAGDSRYLIKDQINGYLCPIANCEYISEKLYELIISPELRQYMGVESKKLIDEKFRPHNVFSAYRNIIENKNDL